MTKRLSFLTKLTAFTMITALALTGCTGDNTGDPTDPASPSATQKVDPNGTFTVAFGTDPGSVSPYLTTIGGARSVFAFGYDTLIATAETGDPIPRLAESWTVDGNSVTYTLKAGITCFDGSEFKASDVAANFDYIKDPATASPWRSMTIPVGYTVTSDDAARTVTITTEVPFGLLLRGAGSLAQVCAPARADATAANNTFMGTGPYTVKDYVSGSHYVLEKRPGYAWGPDGATAEEMPAVVKVLFTANESTAANQLVAGEINAAQILGPDQARVDAVPGMNKALIQAQFGELTFNQAAGRPLSDVRVRQALAAATDRESATAIATNGKGTVSKGLMVTTPVLCRADEVTGVAPDYDLAAAEKMLEEAGWIKGSDGIRVKDGQRLTLRSIYRTDTAAPQAVMEFLAGEWKKVGIEAELVGTTSTVYSEIMYSTLDFDVSYTAMNVEWPFMLTPFYSGPNPQEGGRNSGSINNPKYEELTAQALAAPGDGCEFWNAAHKALIEQVDLLPIADGVRPFFYQGGELKTLGVWTIPSSYRVYAE